MYEKFEHDAQAIINAVQAIAPTWGKYDEQDLTGLREILYQLDRVALKTNDLARRVEIDIRNKNNEDFIDGHFKIITVQ